MSDIRDRRFPTWLVVDTTTMVGAIDDTDATLAMKYDVCDVCEGRGSVVNPNIDRDGLTAADFDEDPDFLDGYMSGRYDVPCGYCAGLRVTPVVNEEASDAASVDIYYDRLRADDDYYAECASERMMGC